MMKKWFTQKTIDVIQWVLIIGLIAMLTVQGINYEQTRKDLVTAAEYNKENTYIRIYESQKLNKLKRENQELYDSISRLKDVESGVIIKFREHYNTDTIRVDRFVLKRDTMMAAHETADSLYHYSQNDDTINLSIDVKARELQWLKADFAINDKFVIINREKDGVNQTLISHSDNTTIEGTTMWHRQEAKKWYQRFTVSPQVGVGYGITTNKVDAYVGFGVAYQFK